MSAVECPHGLDASWCSLCLGRDKPAAPSGIAEARCVARFEARCPCGSTIDEGDELVLIDGEWVHARHEVTS